MSVPILQRKDVTVPAEDEVRKVLRNAISGKDRDEIAAKMSDLLGRTITASMLSDFTRNGTRKRQVRFPAGWVSAFCESVDSNELALVAMGAELRGVVELRDEQVAWLAKSLLAEIQRTNRQRHPKRAKGNRPRKV